MIYSGNLSMKQTHQVVEIFANLSDDSWESWTQKLLHGRGPRGIPAVHLQIIDPLKGNKHIF